ncbi:MAG: DUF1800 family protein [Verrucomicrobiaceae bacterium]|nr:DUF1800 family protein [Verrucomicrobiaceae bacterium]
MNLRLLTLLLCTIALATMPSPCHAAWSRLWTLGTVDGSPNEFNDEAYPNNSSPNANSAITHDDDYYFAGTYALVGTVPSAESLMNFEGQLSTWDPATRIHFTLNAAQAASTSRLRFHLATIWGDYSNSKNFGTHTLTVKINGVTVLAQAFTFAQTLTVTANASAVNAVAGENVIEISRSAGTTDGWFSIDSLGLDVNPTALLDADSDGMPQWWEDEHGLSDGVPADATQDIDADGLTNLQEFTTGTDPRLADTDADGLKDGAETTTNKLLADTDGDSIKDGAETTSNPLLLDSDSDGAPDAWELRVGTNPSLSTSTPPPFTGAIGVKFSSEAAPNNVLTAYQVTGLVPQMNWNNTMVLRQWEPAAIAGTTAHIISPTAGVLKNSAGTSTTTTISWTSDASSASGNSGGSNQDLLNGGLWIWDGATPSVTFSSVPYATYDVLVYVGSTYNGAIAYTRLNDSTAQDQYFASTSTKPQSEFIELSKNDPARPWRANVIRYRNVTGSSFNVKLFRTSWHEAAIHAVQVVNATQDSDSDGMSDAFEVTHKLRPNFNDAALDPDGDGLTNVNEFTRRTDPNKADTDGDGLNDNVETGTGTYVSTSNTGSSALIADTDGDGLGDGKEVTMLPAALNPNNADSDNDGRSDASEVDERTNPLASNPANFMMPVVSGTTSKTFDWSLNFQLVWDHDHGHGSNGEWGDTSVMWVEIQNRELRPGASGLGFGIRRVSGHLTYLFFSNATSAFSYPGQPSSDIWQSDWNNPPTNLRSAMGFSGYGRQDISQRLRLRASGTTTGSASAWNLTVSLFNLDTNQTIASQAFNGCTLASNVHNGTVTWTDSNDVANRYYLDVKNGMAVYFLNSSTSPSIETQPSFASALDTDRDGMPNVWETANSFNVASAADATLDTDSDGLTNVRECHLGTNPRNADSDGDGAKDGFEVDARSNPLLASSKPPYWNGLPSGIAGEDFNGNGINDAFEAWLGRFDLLGSGDADGDGRSNADEAAAGTDPFSASSYLWSDVVRSGNDLVFCWPVLPNKSHQAVQSDNLTSWTNATGTPAVVGIEYQLTLPGALTLPKRFYRASVNDKDTDGDGVSDWTEANVLGSALNNASSTQSSITIDTNADGTPETTIGGDYLRLLEQMQGGASGGGFAGGSPSATSVSKAQAARFLMQAAFGPTLDDIERVQQLGFEGWINEQKTVPVSWHSTYIKQIIADYNGPRADLTYSYNEDNLFGINMQTAFARATIQGSDQLRQRVAFALSQILVTSRRDASLEQKLLGMADYYDLFVKHAFGNYYDVLMDVTLHPCMGRYLSHVGNQKANPEINQYPDENYAREVMQLFSIGLWELNPDGSRKVNGLGQNIPTYSNTEITQLARVLTGLWFGEHDWGQGGWEDADYATPMTMHADKHDFDPKTLIGGFVIPARAPTAADAMKDIQDAIRHLFEHPNTGVFIGKQLIQFLVTDNPSPAYIQRVASVFDNNGSGVRGDLAAVVKAILLDVEARNPATPMHDASYGRLKEPVIRAMSLGRAFGLRNAPNLLWWNWSSFYEASRQEPGYSPSVFNFYRPDYKAPGLLTSNQKNGPVFQITDSFSSIAFPNKLWELVKEGFWQWHEYQFPLDLSREVVLATTPEKLVDHLNLLCCAGQMSASSRTLMVNAINTVPVTDLEARARVGLYLAIVCPEGAVMK